MTEYYYAKEREESAVERINDSYLEALNSLEKLEAENAKLRELVRDMWRDGMCECDERGACAQCEYHFPDRMRELGVEVE